VKNFFCFFKKYKMDLESGRFSPLSWHPWEGCIDHQHGVNYFDEMGFSSKDLKDVEKNAKANDEVSFVPISGQFPTHPASEDKSTQKLVHSESTQPVALTESTVDCGLANANQKSASDDSLVGSLDSYAQQLYVQDELVTKRAQTVDTSYAQTVTSNNVWSEPNSDPPLLVERPVNRDGFVSSPSSQIVVLTNASNMPSYSCNAAIRHDAPTSIGSCNCPHKDTNNNQLVSIALPPSATVVHTLEDESVQKKSCNVSTPYGQPVMGVPSNSRTLEETTSSPLNDGLTALLALNIPFKRTQCGQIINMNHIGTKNNILSGPRQDKAINQVCPIQLQLSANVVSSKLAKDLEKEIIRFEVSRDTQLWTPQPETLETNEQLVKNLTKPETLITSEYISKLINEHTAFYDNELSQIGFLATYDHILKSMDVVDPLDEERRFLQQISLFHKLPALNEGIRPYIAHVECTRKTHGTITVTMSNGTTLELGHDGRDPFLRKINGTKNVLYLFENNKAVKSSRQEPKNKRMKHNDSA
jgi:hypothetical protein